MESKKKSPYELDLEVMDRKPPITPKVGDWVKTKSKEWYEKWKDSSGNVRIGPVFVEDMSRFCGGIYKVTAISLAGNVRFDEVRYAWSMGMFEEVYPQEEYTVSKTFLGYIVTPISKGPTAMEAIHSKEGRISSDILPKDNPFKREQQLLKKQVLSKDITATIPTIDELTKSITVCKLDSSLLFPAPTKQSVQAYIKPETKLRIINTNQLIKIDKL